MFTTDFISPNRNITQIFFNKNVVLIPVKRCADVKIPCKIQSHHFINKIIK